VVQYSADVSTIRVLVLRHHEEDSPGLVGEAFAALGATVETHLYPGEGPLPELVGYDYLVVLGSAASVYETKDWIAAEVGWLRRAPVPVLGICFGAQLLSASFGGNVEPAPHYEIGWVRVEPAPGVSLDDPEIAPGPWFQFHGDRCVLPASAHLLAFNDVGVQAFTIRRHLGVQFHPEVDTAQLERWLESGCREVAIDAGKDPDMLLEQTAREEPEARKRAEHLVSTFATHASLDVFL
jgi:GMP synthase-like glutamine amidotransferase